MSEPPTNANPPEDQSSEARQQPEYEVKATDINGQPRNAVESAPSVAALVERYREDLIQVSEVRGVRAKDILQPRGFDAEQFAEFNADLAAACRAKAPLPGALRVLSKNLNRRAARAAVEDVAREIEDGTDLATALARHKNIFPPAYVALVEAGQASGNLAHTLLLFSQEARMTARVRRAVISAVAYPLTVLFIGSGLLALLGWFVMPTFDVVWQTWDFPGGVPVGTQLLFDLAPVFRWAPVILLVLLAGLLVLWRTLTRRSTSRRWASGVLLRVPLVGTFIRGAALARFCRTLANALTARVPVPQAVELAGLAAGNATVQHIAASAADLIREGEPLSDSFKDPSGIFPATLVWMLSLGEQRGELREALEEYARLAEGQMERAGRALPIWASTALTLLIAMILVAAASSLMAPLLDLVDSMGGY